jgi:transcriptional regulator with XRE-family HTH domain
MGLTVEEAAASAGLGVAAYVALECGRQRLTASVLMRVMRALQSPASLLFDLD